MTFSADKMQGTGRKGETSTVLTGNAKVAVDSLHISGDRIELYGKDYRYIKATGTVAGNDKEKGFTFSCASLVYDRTTEIAEFLGKAKVEDTKNKVQTAAERIEYNQKNEIILLQMNVSLKSKNINCTSLFAVYNRHTASLELTGRPLVKKGSDEFRAAKILVNLDTEDITFEGKVSGSVQEEKTKQDDTQKKTDKDDAAENTEAASKATDEASKNTEAALKDTNAAAKTAEPLQTEKEAAPAKKQPIEKGKNHE